MMLAASASTGWFLENAFLIPLIPAIGFAIIIGFGRRLPKGGSEVGIASMALSLAIAIGATVQWIQRVGSVDEGSGEHALGGVFGFARSVFPTATEGGHGGEAYVEPVIRSWTWWQSGSLEFGLGQHIDGLAVMLLLLVAFISLLVQIFSTEYVAGDRRYTHFFAALTLFSAGMLVMVLAENMIQLILGWEIMGLCSFMLIGHWWEEEANSRAALKAFFTVRVGDMGLLVGTAVIFFGANQWAVENGSNGFSIQAISGWAMSGEASTSALFWGAVALFIACIGKSGQFPLHTWLPDAMAGPTPVSSLLHSSTMVVAGVFLVARLYPVFYTGFDIGGTNVNLIAVIGAITIVIAAALAFVQNDIKKVLAYSTVSQLGYMMLGLGVGAWLPAVFHIFTHAFFKCCLFLAAGSISHSGSHHSFDMKKDMGGLWRKMPITAGSWMISTAALCGVPFFSGFFSKDEIIDNAHNNGYTFFYYVGLVGAAMTAAYMTRATYLTFFGTARGAAAGEHHDEHEAHDTAAHHDDHDADHGAHGADHHDDHHGAHAGPHESPWRITAPLVILAALAIGSGYLNAPAVGTHYFTDWVEPRGAAVELDGYASDEGHSEALGLAALPRAEEGYSEGCGYTDPSPGTVCYAPKLNHAEFSWGKAAPSIILVAFGIGISAWLSLGVFGGRRNPFVGLTRRFAPARWIHTLLVRKYFLDDLYERVIVRSVAHPISKAAYWVNQNILDGVVNGVGKSGRSAGDWVYRNVDQRVVDGAVKASGVVASESGHALQPIQSGRVNQYGALLFGAATVGAILLILLNI